MDKTENNDLISFKVNTKSINKNETKKDKIRYYIFDNFKGILIFTVVFAHFLWEYSIQNMNSLSRKIVVFIYLFHMSGFIFISGFLTSKNSGKISNASKLLILYYIFNFSFLMIIHFYINAPIQFFYPNYSYWYILSLFYWRISINFIHRFKFIFIISIIVSLLVGYWDCFTDILSIVRTFTYFPLFLAGYKIAKIGKFNKFLKWKKGFIKFIIFSISFIYFLFLFIKYINSKIISVATLTMQPYDKNNTIKERIIMIIISCIMILFCLLLLPNIKIPIINKWGKNSLYIYLFHRIITIIAYEEFFYQKKYSKNIIVYSILLTLIILFIFSSDNLNNFCNSLLNSIYKHLSEYNIKGKIIGFLFCLSFILLLFTIPMKKIQKNYLKKIFSSVKKKKQILKITNNYKDLINNSIRISYIGDLILLKDQIIAAKNKKTGKYEFDDMFKYTSKHFHESDLTIGVFEGPCAGNNTNYSTSNYADGLPLYMNYPDEFAEAVSKAGI